MKPKDLKIGTQLKAGIGVILALVVMLAALAREQTDRLWLQTKGLHDHPLAVGRAIGNLQSDILMIHWGMEELFAKDNPLETERILLFIENFEAGAEKHFDTLFDRYLGPRTDIEKLRQAFERCRGNRKKVIGLLQAGDADKARLVNIHAHTGPDSDHLREIKALLKAVDDYALGRSMQFYQDAETMHRSLERQLGLVAAAILLLSLLVSWFLLRNIRQPLAEMAEAAQRFRAGDIDARSPYVSANEFGTLSAGFNSLAETVQSEFKSREAAARIAGVMLREEELHAFCRELLKGLMAHTGSQVGAVYLLNEQKTAFDHFESIGLAPAGRASFSAAAPEGEFGAALATGQIQHLADIPTDARFTFATAGGEFQPREIVTIPVPGDEGFAAVISLAGVRTYPEPAVRLVNDVWNLVTARLKGVLASERIRAFAERIERQNEELQAQQEELEAQAEELRQQTEEVREQNVELERQRLAVEEASRLKSQFLSNMSHELRTPLNSVMALSRVLMMQAKTKLSEEEAGYLEIIERNGKNLLLLINDILDLAKIESGRMDIHPRPFSLGQALENMLESIAPLAGEKQLEIHRKIPEDLPPLESDEIRVSQILQNLLANAVKFTDAGSVSVSVRSDPERVFVRIGDTGIGIAESDLPYIFDEFRQADGSSARKYEGTGLGLAIARKAARMLGGEISVESVPGKGSTFTLTLPLAWPGPAPVHEPIGVRPPSGVKSERKTILVVDDEPDMAASISRYLLQEGYNTVTATSGAEALKLAARDRPFAITLDVVMPDMDGWEVLQSLKKNPDTRDIPVIVVSVGEDRETGFALGAIGYIAKPVSKDRLIAEIRRIGKPRARSILIVDDNDLDRREIRRIIDEEGFDSIVAEDGAACLALLEKQVPDVLVLDLMMPEPDGFTVLSRIRANPETRDLPVIVVTAKDLTAEDRKKLSGNVSSVLEKSAAAAQTLLAEIKRILMELEASSQVPAARTSSAPPRILLVEDNEAAIIQVGAVLESAGYAVAVARGGQEAIDCVSRAIPDGIILDLMMPGIDGFAVLEKIRGTAATKNIPVLILTAKDLTPDDFKRLGANHVQQLVQKGDVDRDSLLEKTAGMLGVRFERGTAGTNIERRIEGKKDLSRTNAQYPPSSPQVPATGNPERAAILIVEDNPDNMVTIRAVLQDRYRIIEATNGEAGLDLAAKARPDLILLDMALPKMDGLTVLRRLGENSALASIPVIAMTARAMKGDREEILAAGCDDYISKPVDPADCIEKIDAWLNK